MNSGQDVHLWGDASFVEDELWGYALQCGKTPMGQAELRVPEEFGTYVLR